MKIKEERK